MFGGIKLAVLVALLALCALSAFETGVAKSKQQISRYEERLDQFERERLELVAENAKAMERAERMRNALAELENQLDSRVPKGEVAPLVDEIRRKLASGIPADRLAFMLKHANSERRCDDPTEVRELQARTPTSTVLNFTNTFAGGRVLVSAEGASARDGDGVSMPHFDPAKPVALRFLLMDGTIERVESVLPLAHSVVLDNSEYRFQARPAEQQGFVQFVVQRCDYP